jgi:hypothetical protein
MTTPTQPGLGRQFTTHNPLNLNYLSRPLLDAREVVRQDTYWAMPPGHWPLDQGQTPRCTGYGMAHEAACGPVVIPGVDTAWADHRYAQNVAMDHTMGNYFEDQGGGATVEATMRAAKADGVVSGYVWNLGLDVTIDATCAVGPQTVGTGWKSSMFNPSPEGLLRVTGADVGGHFYLLAAWVKHPKWGSGHWIVNSWGGWGVGVPELGMATGCAFLQDESLAVLLADQGESTCPRDLYTAPQPAGKFFATATSKVFHTARHLLVRHDRTFASYAAAVAAGLRPCRICRPRP